MKYCVTGATGFIGSHLTRKLLAAGHQVHALVRSESRAGELVKMGARSYVGDITDKNSLREPMAGCDGVFHAAAWYRIGDRNPKVAHTINVQGTHNVLETMRELAIPKVVYTSTLAVFSDTRGKLVDETYFHCGPFLSEYDRTKWEAHYRVAIPMIKDGLPLVIVQPGVVYGPGDLSPIREALVQYLKRKLPIIPKQTAFCWAHVEDTVDAHILAMEKGRCGESYIVAGPPHTFEAVFDLAESITGIRATRVRPSPGIVRAMAAAMTLVGTVVPLPPSYSAESLRVMAGSTYLGDNSKARRELGFRPRALPEGLKETLRYEMKLLGMKTPND